MVISGAKVPGTLPLIGDGVKHPSQLCLIRLQLFHGEGTKRASHDAIQPGRIRGWRLASLLLHHFGLRHLHGEVRGFDDLRRPFRPITGDGKRRLRGSFLHNEGLILDFQLVEVHLGQFQILCAVVPLERDLMVVGLCQLFQGDVVLFLQLAVELLRIAAIEVDERRLQGVLLHLA